MTERQLLDRMSFHLIGAKAGGGSPEWVMWLRAIRRVALLLRAKAAQLEKA